MAYRLIDTPDNADPSVEDFANIDLAAKRAATIIRYSEPDWAEANIVDLLKAGKVLTYHDYSEIRIVEVK